MTDLDIGSLGLEKKLGPFPVWTWVAAGAGTWLIITWYRSRGAVTAESGGLLSPLPANQGGPRSASPAPDPTTPEVIDNEVWIVRCVSWLIGQGYNGLKAGLALRKYLDGEILSAEEATMVNRVMQADAVGPPPLIPVGGGIEPTPVVPTPVTPRPPWSPKPMGLQQNSRGQYNVSGLNVYDFINRVRANLNPAYDMNRLESQNPTIRDHISWSTRSPLVPTFKPNTWVYAR